MELFLKSSDFFIIHFTRNLKRKEISVPGAGSPQTRRNNQQTIFRFSKFICAVDVAAADSSIIQF